MNFHFSDSVKELGVNGAYFASRKSLPGINLIVDIYNYISLKSELAIGAHDVSAIEGDVHLRLTEGTEKFLPLGFSKTVSVKKGEYCYIDNSDEVICRLEVRQGEKTKVIETTTSCFYIVQGNPYTSSSSIISTARELIELTTRFCGGTAEELYFPE
jgi:DNA/RNA-binding domain of Phe-tRNA-synthetase-like protein